MKLKLKTATTIPAGVALKLTPEQYAARSHLLEPFEGDKEVFVGIVPHQFKAGETVEIMGDLPKGILPIYDRQRGLLSDDEINEFETDLDEHPKKAAHKKHKHDHDNENNG